MCCIVKFIYSCLSNDTFWNAITAIATGIIGVYAYKISKEQLRIERYKKDDFLYEKRLTFYQSYTNFLISVINELMKLHNKEISGIDKEFVRPKFLEINRLCDENPLIFHNEKINKTILQTKEEFCHIFGVNGSKQFSPDEIGAMAIEWDKRLSSGEIRKIFKHYFDLNNNI